MSDDLPAPDLATLPDKVRLRILALSADVLPEVMKLPPPLRKVAAFAPARRARLGGSAIATALESDPDFRDRVAAQVAAKLPAPLADLAAVRTDADPVEAAALSWLILPEGWAAVLHEAVDRLAERPDFDPRQTRELDRLRQRANDAEKAMREARTRHREALAVVKAENTGLRRKLGEARSAVREAESSAADAGRAADEARRQAETATSALDKDLRQLRAEVERFEVEALAGRRVSRTDRDEATIRARLLLETVIDAASGLRRELALPAVPGAPGDRVEAELAEEGTRTSSSAGSLGPASPGLLEQYLAMPRARLIVDGYNVSKTAWPSSSLEAQRIRLLNGLAALVARTGAETTVVFDAATTTVRPVVNTPRGVKVRFSPDGVIADDVIRELVVAEPGGRVVVVVTSDQALARDVSRDGARCVAADSLVGLLVTW